MHMCGTRLYAYALKFLQRGVAIQAGQVDSRLEHSCLQPPCAVRWRDVEFLPTVYGWLPNKEMYQSARSAGIAQCHHLVSCEVRAAGSDALLPVMRSCRGSRLLLLFGCGWLFGGCSCLGPSALRGLCSRCGGGLLLSALFTLTFTVFV